MLTNLKKSLNDHSGYLEIDHSASPGISEADIPATLKSSTIAVPEGKKFEADIQQCSHCQRAVVLNTNRVRSRAICKYCYHYICDECDKMLRVTGQCIPFKKVLDDAETLIEESVNRGSIILTDER